MQLFSIEKNPYLFDWKESLISLLKRNPFYRLERILIFFRLRRISKLSMIKNSFFSIKNNFLNDCLNHPPLPLWSKLRTPLPLKAVFWWGIIIDHSFFPFLFQPNFWIGTHTFAIFFCPHFCQFLLPVGLIIQHI